MTSIINSTVPEFKVQAYHNGRILLLTDCNHRRFCSLDHLCGIYHLNSFFGVILKFTQLTLNYFLLTSEDHYNIISLCNSFYSCLHRLCRGVIPAHGIYYYSNCLCHILLLLDFSYCIFSRQQHLFNTVLH